MSRMKQSDALLIVDVQNDFCPGGALAVGQGHLVVPVLNQCVKEAEAAGGVIAASRDWHPPDHISFKHRGGPWPVHCVRGTEGAYLHDDLELPAVTWLVSKGRDPHAEAYSPFDGTGLADHLRRAGVRRLWVGGLALDYCVRAAVLDGLRQGFAVHLIRDATRPVDVNPGDGERALEEMRRAGAVIEE